MKAKHYFGISLLVFFVFLPLKLGGVIAWSWWWVCSPLFFVHAVFLASFVCAMVGLAGLAMIGHDVIQDIKDEHEEKVLERLAAEQPVDRAIKVAARLREFADRCRRRGGQKTT